MEATAPKAGNVHPGAAFENMSYADFIRSAEIIAPILSEAEQNGVGKTVLQSMTATMEGVGCNTNLGIVLLLAPLCAVPKSASLKQGISKILNQLTVDDARDVYQAIRLTQAGGMGTVNKGDISAEPTGTLLEMMQLAAGYDQNAAQYAMGYQDVFEFGIPRLEETIDFSTDWQQAVMRLHIAWIAAFSDSLIIRKCGMETGKQAQQMANDILQAGYPHHSTSQKLFSEFDAWLRADGNRRNPGTSA